MKGNKATITSRRLALRQVTWLKVKELLQRVIAISPPGEQSRIARELGITPSQIHRFACPDCEHDQEPQFSIGFAILIYCSLRLSNVEIIINPTPKDFKKGKNNKGGSGATRNYPVNSNSMY